MRKPIRITEYHIRSQGNLCLTTEELLHTDEVDLRAHTHFSSLTQTKLKLSEQIPPLTSTRMPLEMQNTSMDAQGTEWGWQLYTNKCQILIYGTICAAI